MNKRFKMIASSYPFFIRGGKILLARRINTGFADGQYSVPAGHVEKNETLRENLCREIFEEVGVNVRKEDLALVLTMHRKEEDIRTDYFFTVFRYRGILKILEPDKCDDLRWFPLRALPKNTVPYIRTAIDAWQKGKNYLEFGWK